MANNYPRRYWRFDSFVCTHDRDENRESRSGIRKRQVAGSWSTMDGDLLLPFYILYCIVSIITEMSVAFLLWTFRIKDGDDWCSIDVYGKYFFICVGVYAIFFVSFKEGVFFKLWVRLKLKKFNIYRCAVTRTCTYAIFKINKACFNFFFQYKITALFKWTVHIVFMIFNKNSINFFINITSILNNKTVFE